MAPPRTVTTSSCCLLLIYRPSMDERLSWPSWLTYSGRFTHISDHPSAVGQAQNSKSSPVKDRRSNAIPRNQFHDTVFLSLCPRHKSGALRDGESFCLAVRLFVCPLKRVLVEHWLTGPAVLVAVSGWTLFGQAWQTDDSGGVSCRPFGTHWVVVSILKLICKKYSANANNIYTCIRRAAFGTWLDCLFIMFS